MADVLSQLSEDVICAICHDCFDEPKILDCLHRFCKACLHGVIVSSTAIEGPTCPECRQVIKPRNPYLSTSEWEEQFPTDFLVKSMCDRLKGNRDMCGSHPENQLLSYCQDCRKCICHVCAAVDHRWCLGVTPLRLKAQEERVCQGNYLETLKRNEATCENNIRKIEAEKQTLKQNHDETAKYIKAEFNSARQILEQEERQILTKLGDIMSVQELLLNDEETSETCTLSAITHEKDQVSTSLQLESDAAFMNRGSNAMNCISGGINPGSYAHKTYQPVKKVKLDVIKETLQEIVPDLTEDSHVAAEATRQHSGILLPSFPFSSPPVQPPPPVRNTAEVEGPHTSGLLPSFPRPPPVQPPPPVRNTAEVEGTHTSGLLPSFPRPLLVQPPPSVRNTVEDERPHTSGLLPSFPTPLLVQPPVDNTAVSTTQDTNYLLRGQWPLISSDHGVCANPAYELPSPYSPQQSVYRLRPRKRRFPVNVWSSDSE